MKVTNRVLLSELKKCKKKNACSAKVHALFEELIKQRMKFPHFSYYRGHLRRNMINHALISCMGYWKNFNVDKSSNPVAYFNTVITASFHQVLQDKINSIPYNFNVRLNTELYE